MAGAPAALAEAAAAIAASTPQASQSPFAEAAGAVDAPEVGATSASFTELVGSAPEPPAAEPVVPDLPLGPYTFGARTIVPGKR
jgi:hypothetical protein